jgi:hypothetical protein
MSRTKQILLFCLLFGIVVFSTLWSRQQEDAEYKAVKRIQKQEQAAMDVLLRGDFSLVETERFSAKLREVDTSGAPEHVRVAFSNYLAAANAYEAELRETGNWNTNTAWKIGDRQKEFRKALAEWNKPKFRLF